MRSANLAALPAMLLAALAAAPTLAQEPGNFDYYVLSLSWAPNWCATEGEPDHPQCDGMGWILHGLWPQWEEGWPERCRAEFRDPTRAQAADMADITGSAGLARHAWDRHGTCSGLGPEDYFALSRRAFEAVAIPAMFARIEAPEALPARAVEEAFLAANPWLSADGLTVTCRGEHLQEVRLCLTRDLGPRRCGDDVIRDCRREDAVVEPAR